MQRVEPAGALAKVLADPLDRPADAGSAQNLEHPQGDGERVVVVVVGVARRGVVQMGDDRCDRHPKVADEPCQVDVALIDLPVPATVPP